MHFHQVPSAALTEPSSHCSNRTKPEVTLSFPKLFSPRTQREYSSSLSADGDRVHTFWCHHPSVNEDCLTTQPGQHPFGWSLYFPKDSTIMNQHTLGFSRFGAGLELPKKCDCGSSTACHGTVCCRATNHHNNDTSHYKEGAWVEPNAKEQDVWTLLEEVRVRYRYPIAVAVSWVFRNGKPAQTPRPPKRWSMIFPHSLNKNL